MILRILPEVEREARNASRYLNRQVKGLGFKLLDEFAERLQKIRSSPTQLPILETVPKELGVRRILLKKFKYSIIYKVRHNEIVIVAFSHTSRRPNYWTKRLDK